MEGTFRPGFSVSVMGQDFSAEQKQYMKVLKQLLKENVASVMEDQLQGLLEVVIEQNPWFPDQGTLDLEVWERIGKNFKCCHKQSKKVSLASLAMWGLVRSSLAPLHTENTSNIFKEKEGELTTPLTPQISPLTSQVKPNKEEELPPPPD